MMDMAYKMARQRMELREAMILNGCHLCGAEMFRRDGEQILLLGSIFSQRNDDGCGDMEIAVCDKCKEKHPDPFAVNTKGNDHA